MTPIRERVAEIVQTVLDVEADAVTDTARLTEDLQADSLDLAQVCLEVAAEFEIDVTAQERARIVTVGQLARLVEEKVAHAG